jgi:hypothetical protein
VDLILGLSGRWRSNWMLVGKWAEQQLAARLPVASWTSSQQRHT